MYGSHYILLHVDGDVNSQFKLGQELLARSSSSGDGSDVERGVSWLCKASRQGGAGCMSMYSRAGEFC